MNGLIARFVWMALTAVVFSGWPKTLLDAAEIQTDVIIYGATWAGVCAAIGAAREGVSVALVEPSRLGKTKVLATDPIAMNRLLPSGPR